MDSVRMSGGRRSEKKSVAARDGSIGVILMNPPCFRTRGGQSAFDTRGLSDRERDACQNRRGKLVKK